MRPTWLGGAIPQAMDENQGTQPSTQGSSSSGQSPEDVKREREEERKEQETGDLNQAAKEAKRDSNW